MKTSPKQFRLILLSIFLILFLTGCDQDSNTPDTVVYTPECDVQALIDAIDDGNADGAPSEIQLPPFCIYTLTQVENSFPWNNMIINNGLPAITSEITIQGNSSTIQIQITSGDDPFGHFYLDVESKLYLYDLTLKGGVRNAGGSILSNHGELVAHNVQFIHNRALQPTNDSLAHGGAIYSYFSKVRLSANSLFQGNYAGVPVPSGPNLGGAVYSINSVLTINDTYFQENYVAGHGGAIYSEKTATHTGGGTIIIQNASFFDNEAVQDGGAMYLLDETDGVYIASGQFNDNLSGNFGGAVFSQDSDVMCIFCGFHYNQAEYGGAIYTRRSAEGEWSIFAADSSVFTNNVAEESAGAFFSENADLEAVDTIFVHNQADSCGGIQLGGYPGIDVAAGDLETAARINSRSEISTGSVSYNQALYGNGGGACHLMGELVLEDVGFNGNQTPLYGGGLLSLDVLETTESIFSGNQAHRGGGLAIGFPVDDNNPHSPAFLNFYSRLTQVWVTNNIALDQGGGIWAHNGGSLQVVKSTIGYNSADQEGGGVYLDEGNIYLDNSTLAENTAYRGGGLYNVGGNSTLRLMHTTVAYNTATDTGTELRSKGGGVNINGVVYMREVMIVLNSSNDCDLNQGLRVGGDYETCDEHYCSQISSVDSDDSCGFAHTTPNPQLGGFNGTYVPILSGSPIIDSAGTCLLTDDQIGTGRPQGIQCEPGSIEYLATAPPPPPPPPSAPEPEEEEEQTCDPFEGLDISVRLLNINPDTLILPVYLLFDEVVPEIGENGNLPYFGRLGGEVSYLTNQQGFDNRAYFMFVVDPSMPGTLQDLEIFKEGCEDSVFSQPRLTIPEISADDQPADDQPEPSCNKDLGESACEKAGGVWFTGVDDPYCLCPE